MQRDSGNPTAPIWLIGDSEPAAWRDQLDEPLDARHPTRHNIWTPIWDSVQERIFTTCSGRLARSSLFVCNAVRDSTDKPGSLQRDWGLDTSVTRAVAALADALVREQPLLVIAFGQFSFEFCRRAAGEQPLYQFDHWTMAALGAEFRRRLALQSSDSPLVVPLLHSSIAQRSFMDGHTRFCGAPTGSPANYFVFAGVHLADWILERRATFEAHGAFM